MTEPDPNRPGSAAAGSTPSPVPPSPKPSVASRASRNSLRRERQEGLLANATPSPQAAAAAAPPEEAVELRLPHPAEPPFSPLFTLLTSTHHPAQHQTTHHPVMHYIFADDDPEALTEALASHHRSTEEAGDNSDGAPSGPDNGSERAVVLEMAQNDDGGLKIAWASSLSPDWAVIDARVTQMEGEGAASAVADYNSHGPLMLRIEGVTVGGPSPSLVTAAGKAPSPERELQSSRASGSRPTVKEEYAGLIEDFEKRMGVLSRVVEASEDRLRRVAMGEEEGDDVQTHPLAVTSAGHESESPGQGSAD